MKKNIYQIKTVIKVNKENIIHWFNQQRNIQLNEQMK